MSSFKYSVCCVAHAVQTRVFHLRVLQDEPVCINKGAALLDK